MGAAWVDTGRLHDPGERSGGRARVCIPEMLAEVSMLLGHSEMRVTMDFYAHLQQQTAAKAARQMDAILG